MLSPHTCDKILMSLTVKDCQGINLANIVSENNMHFLKYPRVEHGRDIGAGHDKVEEKVEETN